MQKQQQVESYQYSLKKARDLYANEMAHGTCP